MQPTGQELLKLLRAFMVAQPCRYLLAVCLNNVGALTSRNPMGLQGLEQGYLYFTLLYFTLHGSTS
jgi:hypothetical protein